MKTKTLRWYTTIIFISLLSIVLGSCGGSSSSNDPPADPTTGTISGTVAGTEIVAVDDSGAIVASDDTTGKTADAFNNYPFTLTSIPVGANIRVYLITASGVYPLYFDSAGGTTDPNTNVFSLSAVVTIDLGFVNTAVVGQDGRAIPGNNPVDVAGVNDEAENTATPVLPGGTLTVNVTDNTGAPLSGATVIVDHASDPRQVDTTIAGSVSFTTPSGGPVTVTIGMSSGYEIVTLIDINIASLPMALEPMGLSAFVEGTATNLTGFGRVDSIGGGDGDLNDDCPSCENLDNGTIGFYRLETDFPNSLFNLSAFDYGSGSTPINFTAVTGIGPLTDGQTLTVDLTFPAIAPATTTTTGNITVPGSLGAIFFTGAWGVRDFFAPGGLMVGHSGNDITPPYDYILTTFDFAGGAGTSNDVIALVGGSGGMTLSVNRGVGFGGTGVDFTTLIDVPTSLSPTGACGGINPTFSWTGVAGASISGMDLTDSDTSWLVITYGSSTGFALPDLTGTPLAGLGLSTSDPVNWSVRAMVVPGFNFNTIDLDIIMRTFTDMSESVDVTCTP